MFSKRTRNKKKLNNAYSQVRTPNNAELGNIFSGRNDIGPSRLSFPYEENKVFRSSQIDLPSTKIIIPGKTFNEISSRLSSQIANKPGKGRTIRSNIVCASLFDYQNNFNVTSCKDRDVLIVSHNKRLLQLIGEMFPQIVPDKYSTCPYGIANCAVLEITKNEKPKSTYQFQVLFDGFPDENICQAKTVEPNRGYEYPKFEKRYNPTTYVNPFGGGGDNRYEYFTSGKLEHKFQINVADVTAGTFRSIFDNGAKKIILVRDGNAPHNKPCANKLFENPPLTALGVYQAYIAGTEMGKKKYSVMNLNDENTFRIFTSQLKRAQQTTLQFLAAFLDADTTLHPTGTRPRKTIRGISNNTYTFFKQEFKKNCEDCLKRFNMDTKQIDKTSFSRKLSKRSCSFQKLLDDPKFFESNFMQTHALKYNKSDFLRFVNKYDLISQKSTTYTKMRQPQYESAIPNSNSDTLSIRSEESQKYPSSYPINFLNNSVRKLPQGTGQGMKPPKHEYISPNNVAAAIVGKGNNMSRNYYYTNFGGKKTRHRKATKGKRSTRKIIVKRKGTRKQRGKERGVGKKGTRKQVF